MWLSDCAGTMSSLVLTSLVYKVEASVMSRVFQNVGLPNRFHELIRKITMT
jgi:hypothetical protein